MVILWPAMSSAAMCHSVYTVKDSVKTSTQTLLLRNSTTENVLEIMHLRSLSFVSCIHLGGPNTFFFFFSKLV